MERVLRSVLFTKHGFTHGFSLRTGGVSHPPFDTLNLGRAVGDEPARVERNHALYAEAVSYNPTRLFEVSQVHGAGVRVLSPGDRPEGVRREEADALLACRAGDAVAVRVADCVPVLLADPETGAVAAVHAGWRGAVASIVPAAVDALVAHAGSRPESLLSAIGPHIRAPAFEVGEEVAGLIVGAAPGRDVVRAGSRRPHADLALLVRAQLEARGVTAIDDVGGCTFQEPARFFSYRRDGRRSGRHLAVIVGR